MRQGSFFEGTSRLQMKPWLVLFRVPGCAWIEYHRCATEYEAFKAAQKLQWRLRGHYEYQWIVS